MQSEPTCTFKTISSQTKFIIKTQTFLIPSEPTCILHVLGQGEQKAEVSRQGKLLKKRYKQLGELIPPTTREERRKQKRKQKQKL